MLLPFFPVVFVDSTIWPFVDSIPMLFVVKVLSLKSSSITKGISTKSTHLSFVPLSTIDSSIFPLIYSKPMNYIILPLTDVFLSVMPFIYSTALFLAFRIFPEVFSSISPNCMTLSMLQSIPPATSENSSILLSQKAIAAL